jgi:hypothetical protein
MVEDKYKANRTALENHGNAAKALASEPMVHRSEDFFLRFLKTIAVLHISIFSGFL